VHIEQHLHLHDVDREGKNATKTGNQQTGIQLSSFFANRNKGLWQLLLPKLLNAKEADFNPFRASSQLSRNGNDNSKDFRTQE
jgi:hypothetical protein